MRSSAIACAGILMPRSPSKTSFPRLAKSILTAVRDANPTRAASQGLHRYDGRLPDYSRRSVERRVNRVRRDLRALDALERGDGVSGSARLEAGVLRSLLLKERFSLVEARAPFRSPKTILDHLSIVNYLMKEYAPLDRRLRAIARLEAAVPGYLRTFRRVVDRRLGEPLYEAMERSLAGIAESHRKELEEVLPKASPAVRRLVARTRGTAVAEFETLRSELPSIYKPRVKKEFAIGRRNYERMLWAEHLARIPVERLLDVGMADLEANKRAFVETAATIDKSRSPRDVQAGIAADHPTAGSLIPDTQAMLEEIRTFLLDRDIVSVPSEDRPTVVEMPHFYRWASAAMNPPGAFEKVAREAYYYVTPVEPSWGPEKAEEWLRYLNYASLRNISVHECFPGHFVHFLHMRNVKSEVLRSHWSTAFGEGWAHYTEEMMLEQGFAGGDPKARLAQLQDALLRNCRYVSSIRMHVYGWTWQQSTRFFMENAFMDRLPAEREARRGTFDPGFLNYTLGKLMIKKLRADWMAAHPDASLREFHDAFLALGAPPLGLARQALLGRDAGPAL